MTFSDVLSIHCHVVCVTDAGTNADCNPKCLAAVRLLLLSASSTVLSSVNTAAAAAVTVSSVSVMPGSSAGLMTCRVLRQCLLPLADVLQSAGSHVYLSTVKLHRAMMMMVLLTTELSTTEGNNNNNNYYYYYYYYYNRFHASGVVC